MFILNDANAVRTFSQAGSVSLGGNVSIAAGPVGRNAEAAGMASSKGVAGVFAYSKTKGLFAGVSLEGSVIVERKDANEKMYNRRVSAAQLLSGAVPAPIEADPLMRILNARVFSGNVREGGDTTYNDAPVYEDSAEDLHTNDRRDVAKPPSRSSTWHDDVYDREPATQIQGINRAYTARDEDPYENYDNSRAAEKPKPPRPTAPKPTFGKKADQATAKFNFEGEQDGDLSFRKGDIITILKKTEKDSDWWTGRIGNKEGIFPRQVHPFISHTV